MEMAGSVRLVVFDLDGTLVDSAATIVACVQDAFAAERLEVPSAAAVRGIVGLSLLEACTRLMDRPDLATAQRLADGYRTAFLRYRQRPEYDEPLFPAALEALEAVAARGLLMGVATGKAMRGLRHALDHHRIGHYFTTLQTADLHPSKPHPAMLEAAMREAGAAPAETVLVGDTTFDMEMALAAGARPIGVAWGNHAAADLRTAGAPVVLERFGELARHLD